LRPAIIAASLSLTPAAFGATTAQPAAAGETAVGAGLAELRHVVGAWDVRTEFLNPDGSIARAVDGSYAFEWAIPDAVLSGIARQPELGGATAILLYLRPAAREVEMVAVDQAGVRWVMTGEDGTNVRSTEDRLMSDGSRMRLRFTRYNVAPDRFESKMEYSTDGGATWSQGNRQVFRRRG
jgi:hypothetical protein